MAQHFWLSVFGGIVSIAILISGIIGIVVLARVQKWKKEFIKKPFVR